MNQLLINDDDTFEKLAFNANDYIGELEQAISTLKDIQYELKQSGTIK